MDELDDELEPVTDPSIIASMREHDLALEDEAMERFPELAKFGAFGDPVLEEMLDFVIQMTDSMQNMDAWASDWTDELRATGYLDDDLRWVDESE